MSRTRHIVAFGGGILQPETGNVGLERYVRSLSDAPRPVVCYVPTASGDDAAGIARFFETYLAVGCVPRVLPFFRRTPVDLRAFLEGVDIVHVGGGNTRSMLAVWRDWGFVDVLREAYERGVVLCGSSAGAICWFEQGVTDSLAGPLTPLTCLGFVEGSNCPHYDGEKERRPAYTRLVGEGAIKDGYACDDGAGVHFVGGTFHQAVSARPNATAYRVSRNGAGALEAALPATRVT